MTEGPIKRPPVQPSPTRSANGGIFARMLAEAMQLAIPFAPRAGYRALGTNRTPAQVSHAKWEKHRSAGFHRGHRFNRSGQ